MNKVISLLRSRFLFASPWLLTAAAGLLIIIVVTFAFHNLRLEKRLMTNAMLQKGATLIKAVQSGARASYISDIRRNFWESDTWHSHVQKMIDHLIEDPDILEITLIDDQGKIIAHNDKKQIGTTQSVPPFIKSPPQLNDGSRLYYSIVTDKRKKRLFNTTRLLKPFVLNHSRLSMNMKHSGRRNFFMDRNRRNMGPPIINRAPGESNLNKPFFIVVGLDMTEYDHTLGRLRVQIFILSLAMLLVGLAGWFSLSVIQGYRVSQKTLNEIQAFTTLLITSLPVGIIATNQSGRIATWNLAIEKITGIIESDAVGKLPREILHEALAAFFSGKESNPSISTDEREIQIAFAGDMYVLLCRLIQIFDREQKYVGAVLLISDISKVKQLEQKMRESEKLAAIGKMAGGVAHEVRNPLSSIKGLALLLKNKFVAGSKERDTAQLLIQETERMNRTITEMLSFSRPTSLCLQPVDVPRLLEKEIELIQAETLENNIEVSLATKEDLKQIKGDKDRLTQLLMNILLNSIQAMPEGGVITIEAENSGSGDFVQLTISDTGIGMAESVLSQVFYPYFTTKQQGTGIGLAISQKIILDHNGSIAIASQPGKGTVVTMQLPSVDNHDVAV